ncbi:hypothetical protein NC651_019295 [Populus alba x Populus x berolinensis]|nr:hypothetical protein NC651_019295 [Populus alba x Populus x berolinensis]
MVELNAKQELFWHAVVGIVHCCGKVGPLQLQNTGLFHKDSQRKYQAKSISCLKLCLTGIMNFNLPNRQIEERPSQKILH